MRTGEYDILRKALRFTFLLALLAPPILTSALVVRHYLPVPYWDEWVLAPLVAADEVSPADFFVQHNEHRHFFPKLILTLVARATNWSLSLEPWLSPAFALVSVLLLVAIASSRARTSPVASIVVAFGSGVFLFSPSQHEVFLWPWMIVSTMSAALACGIGLCLATKTRSRFFGAIGLAFLAGLTSAQGLFSWLAFLPAAAWSSERHRVDGRALGIWSFSGVMSGCLYFFGFKAPTESALIDNLGRPIELALFILSVVGAPWTQNDELAVVFGGFQVAAFVMLIAASWKLDSARMLAIFGLGAWVLVFAGATAAGRLQYGIPTALSSRYHASSALFPCVLLVLTCFFVRRGVDRRFRAAIHAGVVIIAASVWLHWIDAASVHWRSFSLVRQQAAACLAISVQTNVSDNRCLQLLYPNSDELIEKVERLERKGIRMFRNREPLPIVASEQPVGTIYPRAWPLENEEIKFSGVVVDDPRSLAGLVLLDIGTPELWCCGFAQSDMQINLPTDDQILPALRWTAPMDLARLGGETRVFAFALLANPARLSPLQGHAAVSIDPAEETVYSDLARGGDDPNH